MKYATSEPPRQVRRAHRRVTLCLYHVRYNAVVHQCHDATSVYWSSSEYSYVEYNC
jgi:hypothetical protein